MPLLTKSKYMVGLQCPRYLWTLVHDPSKIPEPDLSTQYRFDQGHLVGQLAKQWFPLGIDIPEADFKGNISKTKELLKEGKPLFEAGILVGNIYSRADILVPNGDGWDIVEVKSGTKVKEENIHDVSFQKHVYSEFGLKIKKCFLLHVNNEYVKKGEINPKELLVMEDITEEVEKVMEGISGRVENMLAILSLNMPPDTKISASCTSPYTCPIEECWKFLPENNVFHLYRIGKKAFELVDSGVQIMGDVPSDFKLSDKQEIQVSCEKTGKPYVNKAKIKEFLSGLEYPRYYLDFETFSTVVPLFDGVRPYQQIPFQFSLHVESSEGLKHYEFLASGQEDPRLEFLKALKKVLGSSGSVVVYNQAFEKRILSDLGEAFSEEDWVSSVFDRMVDLLVPFREFSYYHPMQKGSASIKKVLPAVTGKDYSSLDIADGETASISYLNVTFGDVSEAKRKKVRKDLLKYCKLDTEGMRWVVGELKEMS